MSRKTPAEEAEELRQVVAEAHGAIKDLTRLLREVKQTKVEIETAVHNAFDEQMTTEIKAGLDRFGEVITTAIGEAEKRVDARFDTIADILLGEDKKSVRNGGRSLSEYAQLVAEKRSAES